MAKVKVKIKINNQLIEEKGILNGNVLKLKEDQTNITFDYNNLILTRENKEYKIILDFKNKKVTYNLKENTQKFYNNLTILSLTNYDKQVMINYRVEEDDFSLDIMYETI